MESFLRRFTISNRLNALSAFFVVVLIMYGIWSTVTLFQYKVNGPVYDAIVLSKDLTADILPPAEFIVESFLVTNQIARSAMSNQSSSKDAYISALNKLQEEFETRHEFWKKQAISQDKADLLLVKAYQPAKEFYTIAFNELIPAANSQDAAAIDAAMLKLKQKYELHYSFIEKLVDVSHQYAAKEEKEALDNVMTATSLSFILLGVFVVIVVITAYIISKSIIAPLNKAIEVAEVVATGNLKNNFDVQFNDEPGKLLKSLKKMNEHLASTVHSIRMSAELVATSAKEIEMGNLDLSSRTEEQASSLETTASTMEELTSTVKQNAENAALANKLVANTSDVAVKGGNVVQKVVNNMGLITQSSKKIEDIIGVIDGIAFQTNILALNAAVEAARAGEQGRGFAVVASEVRNLAQRSAAAAKEIKGLIAESVNTVDAGSILVAEAGVNMDKIVTSIQQVSDLMSEIASASSEQSVGIEQVSTLLNQMDEVTQQNTALVEESAAASGSMQHEAENLRVEISRFILDTDGNGFNRMSPRHTALY